MDQKKVYVEMNEYGIKELRNGDVRLSNIEIIVDSILRSQYKHLSLNLEEKGNLEKYLNQ